MPVNVTVLVPLKVAPLLVQFPDVVIAFPAALRVPAVKMISLVKAVCAAPNVSVPAVNVVVPV